MHEIKRILVGLDYSEYSREAAKYAVYLAKKVGAAVDFVHVLELPAYLGTAVGLYGMASLKSHLKKEDGLKESSLEELKQFVAEFKLDELESSCRVVAGNPPSQIINLSVELESDMIVLGTHGRAGISQLIIGSVAEKVVRKASCPVLTIKLTNQTFVI